MISQNLIIVLLVFYGVLMVAALVENKWALSLYWLSSIAINLAVLYMNK